MGEIKDFVPEKLVIPMMFSDGQDPRGPIEIIVQRFGRIDFQSDELCFGFTKYYEPEMGEHLTKIIIAFAELVSPQELADIKLYTNEIEQQFAMSGKRKVNLDPGLIGLRRFILATSKDNGHRIPLQRGIYAEITMLFMEGDFTPLLWTYPDYQTDEYRGILREIRDVYKQQLKKREQ